jgi:hypothetical protein
MWSVQRRHEEQIQLGILWRDPSLKHDPARVQATVSRYPFHAGSVASAVRGPWGRWEWRKSVRSARSGVLT